MLALVLAFVLVLAGSALVYYSTPAQASALALGSAVVGGIPVGPGEHLNQHQPNGLGVNSFHYGCTLGMGHG